MITVVLPVLLMLAFTFGTLALGVLAELLWSWDAR